MDDALLIATGNRDKVYEIRDFLAELPWDVICLADLPPVAAPIEDGDSFESNATKKALFYSAHFGRRCVADDSGLVVDALGGAPGVLSARYAGNASNDADNNAKLLQALTGVPEMDRSARFVCCAVLADADGMTHAESGVVEGTIALEARGSNGFGYDPVFVPSGYAKTFGELGASIKGAISHRARAFGKIRSYLESFT